MIEEIYQNSIFRIAGNNGQTLGTGFVIGQTGLALTCRHVLDLESGPKSDRVLVAQGPEPLGSAFLLDPHLQPPNHLDVVLLSLDSRACRRLNKGLPIGSCRFSPNRDFQTYGFPRAHSLYGTPATGTIIRVAPIDGSEALHLDSEYITWGYSGAPVIDAVTDYVVGVVAKFEIPDEAGRGGKIAYAIPMDTIAAQSSLVTQHFSSSIDVLRSMWFSWEMQMLEQLEQHVPRRHHYEIDSPLFELWEDFIGAVPWHIRLRHQLAEIKYVASHVPNLDNLCRRIENIDYSVNYEQLVVSVREIVNHKFLRRLRELRSELQQSQSMWESYVDVDVMATRARSVLTYVSKLIVLAEECLDYVEHPRFNKCFLVLGEWGSGKSHFARSLLAHEGSSAAALQSDEVLTLWLEPDASVSSWEHAIVSQIRQITKVEWADLQSFDEFLEANPFSVVDEESEPERKFTSILQVVIDDLERIGHAGVYQLVQFIASSTYLHSICWVLLADHSFYVELARLGPSAWLYYSGISPQAFPSWRRHHSVLRPALQTHSAGSDEDTLPHVEGWIVLHTLNSYQKLGINLLADLLEEQEGDGIALQKLEQHSPAFSYVCSPYIAWLIWDLRETLNIRTLATLTYVGFITSYWSRQAEWIADSDYDHEDIVHTIKAISTLLQQLHVTKFPSPRLEKFVLNTAQAEYPVLTDIHKYREIIRLLEFHGLLRRTPPSGSTFPDFDDEEVSIAFEVYWAWMIALDIWKNLRAQRNFRPVHIVNALEVWFHNSEDSEQYDKLAEWIVEFCLLLADQPSAHVSDAELSYELWAQVLTSKLIPDTPVWLSAPKASQKMQQMMLHIARTQTEPIESDEALFAMMYFLSDASPGIGSSVTERLALLHPHYLHIEHSKLVYYFLYLISQLLSAVSGLDELVQCLICFEGCEVMHLPERSEEEFINDLPHKLAQASLRNIRRVVDNDPAKVLTALIEYLQVRYNRMHSDRVRHTTDRQGPWKRFFFHEWLMYESLHYLFDQVKIVGFEMLRQHDWFHTKRLHIRWVGAEEEMEREASIAFGFWYRVFASPREKQEYLIIVQRLSRGTFRERRLAFFLIYHTRPADRTQSVIVDREFRPALSNLCNDPDLAFVVNKFRSFVMANVHDFRGRR